jgi:cholest-4-en-3-one 26-monooxygenase
MTIDLLFNTVTDHMPIKPPERLRSGWLNGIEHWQVDYHVRSTEKCPIAY